MPKAIFLLRPLDDHRIADLAPRRHAGADTMTSGFNAAVITGTTGNNP